VLIFPEGGRSETGELQEFSDGAAYVALKAAVPIVPLTLKGTRDSLPTGSGIVKPAHVELIVGDPIPTEGMSPRERAALTAKIRGQIATNLG